MDKEIKFRGKSIDTDRWIYGFYLEKLGKSFMQVDGEVILTPVDPATVGQYIGLADKLGSGAYLGDIVRFTQTRELRGHHKTVSDTYTGTVSYNFYGQACLMVGEREFHIDNLWKGEIIGNVTDSIDLLTK